jgi:hypothetical protein
MIFLIVVMTFIVNPIILQKPNVIGGLEVFFKLSILENIKKYSKELKKNIYFCRPLYLIRQNEW